MQICLRNGVNHSFCPLSRTTPPWPGGGLGFAHWIHREFGRAQTPSNYYYYYKIEKYISYRYPEKKHDTNEERIYKRKKPAAPRTKRRQTDQAEDKARAAAVYDLICRQALHVAKQAEAEALAQFVPTERGLAHPNTLSSFSGTSRRSE